MRLTRATKIRINARNRNQEIATKNVNTFCHLHPGTCRPPNTGNATVSARAAYDRKTVCDGNSRARIEGNFGTDPRIEGESRSLLSRKISTDKKRYRSVHRTHPNRIAGRHLCCLSGVRRLEVRLWLGAPRSTRVGARRSIAIRRATDAS